MVLLFQSGSTTSLTREVANNRDNGYKGVIIVDDNVNNTAFYCENDDKRARVRRLLNEALPEGKDS